MRSLDTQLRLELWSRVRIAGPCGDGRAASREVWQEAAPKAGIPIDQQGLWIAARRPESAAVLEAFLRTDMAESCRLLDAGDGRRSAVPSLNTDSARSSSLEPARAARRIP